MKITERICRGGVETYSFAAVERLARTLALPVVAFTVAAGAGLSAVAAEQTLAVSLSGDAFTVSVPANSYDDTSKLYLVWGALDCGEKISAWPSANRILYDGAISATAATYSFSTNGIPAGSVVRAIVSSDVRLIDGYLRISGNRCLNTRILDTSAYGVDFKCQPLGTSSASYSALVASMTDKFILGMAGASYTSYYLRYGGTASVNGPEVTNSKSRPSIGNIESPHTFRIFGGKLYFDGVDKNVTAFSGTCGQTETPVRFGGAVNVNKTTLERFCRADWYYAQVLDDDGSLLGNFVPALVGDPSSPSPVFYDSVSGRYFATDGSGTADTCSGTVTNTVVGTAAVSAVFSTGVTAYWTGLGDLANVNDPANWACTNALGVEVTGAHPDTNSIVYVRGATNFNVPAGQRLAYNELHIENCSLATNCDWRGLAASDTVEPIYTLQYLDAPKGAYIDTAVKPNQDTRVVMDITVRDSSKREYWFGAWDTGNHQDDAFAVGNDYSNIYSAYPDRGGGHGSVLANGRHTIDFFQGVLKVTTGGSTYTHTDWHDLQTTRNWDSTFQLNNAIWLFVQNRKGSATVGTGQVSIRLHSCKIYDGDSLIRDYVPVQNNGYVCLYDRVNGTYATNRGSGSFTAGPAIGDTVGFYSVTRPTRIDTTVDLAGHSLTLAHAAGTGTIKDTAGGGELHIDVANGETVENSTLTFAGQMKLVKDGAGTFVGVKAQTYTGGTVANAGWLKQGAYSGSWGPHKSLITILTGAGFDWNGMVNDSSTTAYSFKIAGTGPDGDASMKTSVDFASNYWNANFIADMELDGDTTVKTGHAARRVYGFLYKDAFEHNLEMNGHTLTVVADDSFGFRGVTATGGGTIVSVPDTSLNTGMRRLSFYGATNDLSTTTLDIHDRCGLNVEWPVIVTNLIDRRTLQWNDGTTDNNGVSTDVDSTAGIFVIGRFQPHSTNLFTKVALGDATHLSPTFDLSLLDDTFVEPASGDIVLNFADGANVIVDVGSRAVAVGDKLISWRGIPDCGFTLVYSGEERQIEAVARTDGLYVKSSAIPAYAMLDMTAETPDWVFYDVNGSVVPGWEDGVTAEMQVRFASYEEYLAVKAKNVSPLEYLLSGSFTLPEGSGTCDMSSGFDFTPGPGVTIDVAGRKLVLPDSMVAGVSPFTVTSSVEGGELEVTVGSGTTITNTAMSLAGSLKLTKKGAGTFVGAKADQTYNGGTFVNEGIAQSGAYNGAWGAHKSVITVADGASFDYAGKVETSTSTAYSFVAEGTGVGGAGAIYTSVPCPDYAFYNQNHIADMELAGDMLITIPTGAKSSMLGFRHKDNLDMHYLTMNNHTLTLVIGDRFAMSPVTTIGSGTIVCLPDEDGTTYNYNQISFYGASSDLSTVTLDLHEGTAINIEAASKVGSFIDRRTVKGVGQDRVFTVLERFQPTGANTLFTTMQLGDATHLSPTLDLGSVTGAYTIGSYALTYPSGATVTVNLAGTRTDLKSIARTKDGSGNPAGYVLTWASKPANVEFALDETSKKDGYKIEATDSGLLLTRKTGLVLIFK